MIKERQQVYDRVTNRILENLEKGVIPWRKSWKFIPRNFFSKHQYKGSNFVLLSCNDFESHFYATFNQIKNLGHRVNKGAKSESIVFWKFVEKDEVTEDGVSTKTIPLIRSYNVFNIEQTTIEPPNVEKQNNPLEKAEEIINNTPHKPEIQHFNKMSAHYSDKNDVVNIPSLNLFDSAENYYSTLFHELLHSTGHISRLNRETLQKYFVSKEERAKEELIAEIGASYLCAHCGIDNFVLESSSSYIESWLKVLKDNKKAFINLASQAQKAVEFILHNKSNAEIGSEKLAV